MRIEVMRGHTKSIDANDKLIQTRSHVRNAIASRERQVVMRKVKSTIHPLVLRLGVYHEQCVGFELIKHHLKLSTNLIVVLLRLYICFSSKRDSITSPSNALTKSRPRTIFATFAAL